MTDEATVYIDKLYDDAFDELQPWPRRRREVDERPWVATTGGTAEVDEEGSFGTADDAIAWARGRAKTVLVRLGHDVEAFYTAGDVHAAWLSDGSGWRFPPWPPAAWPDYSGPPEPGWPEFQGEDDE